MKTKSKAQLEAENSALRARVAELESLSRELSPSGARQGGGSTVVSAESERQFRQLFGEMMDGFALHEILCDAQGKPSDYRFLAVNPAFEEITGLTASEIVGRRVLEVLPQTDASWIANYGRVALRGESLQFENYSKDLGKYFEVRAFCPERGKFAVLFHDITERRRTEGALRLDESRLEALLRFSTMAAASEKEITDFALEEGVRLTNSQVGYLHFVHSDQVYLQLFTWSREVYKQCTAEKTSHYPLEQAGVWVDCVRQRRPIIHNDYQNLPDKKGYPAGHIHVARHLSVPVLDGGKVVAVAGVGNKAEPYDETDARQLSLFMNGMWVLLQRKRIELALQQLNTELEQRVRERTAQVEDLYHNAPCGYHSLDREGLIVHVNDTELRWLGYTRAELVGRKHFAELLTKSSSRRFQERRTLFQERGWVNDLELLMIRKDGTSLPVLLSESAVRDGEGKLLTSRATLFDITKRKQAEQELQQRRAELSAANVALAKAARLKDEFLASMSHELRTPLTGILGLAEALQEQVYGPLNDKQLRSLQTIQESGLHLLELINDVLDLSKIAAGQLDLQMERCPVADVCQSSLQLIREMAHRKGQQVSFTIQPPAIDLCADARRLRQMLFNLLGNAVKFAPSGGRLGLEVEGDEEAGVVRFHVWDTGIGIAAEDLPKLFRAFTQLDSRLTRHYSGTGLGLSLVQRMADLHGGSMSVESNPGQGSRFTLTLPWRMTAANTLAKPEIQGPLSDTPAQGSAAERTDGNYLILVVDDNQINLDTYSAYLQAKGYRVAAARLGSEVLAMVAELKPDLLLLDVQMPGMDGLALMQCLRSDADRGIAAIPVIALTALTMPGDRERCLAAGANAYLSKPVNLAQLLHTVATQLVQNPAPWTTRRWS
jgi:PAS domain S-box-containing protein